MKAISSGTRRRGSLRNSVRRILGMESGNPASQSDYRRVSAYLCKAMEDLFGRNNVYAEDLVQQAIIKAWENKSTWSGKGSLTSWLVKIARHCAIDKLRADSNASFQLYQRDMLGEEVARLAGDWSSTKSDHVFGLLLLRKCIAASGDQKVIEFLDALIESLDQVGRRQVKFTCSRLGITSKEYKARASRLRTASRRLAPAWLLEEFATEFCRAPASRKFT